MKLAVRHTTTYEYSRTVADSINDAHLHPTSNDGQRCESFDLTVEPASAKILRRLDFYTNQVHHIEVHEPHDRLVIRADSVVETLPDPRGLEQAVPAESLKALKANDRFYDFLNESPRIPLVPQVVHIVANELPAFDDVRQGVEDRLAFIDREFTYQPGETTVSTTVPEAIEARKGVCQDFAHVMLALCRASGIPARYVSGYFHVDTPSEDPADANHQSHAWVECYLPDIGWAGYDPTHNRPAGERYVKVAVGRDYADVRPVAGTFRGKAEARLEVRVRVERLD